jgi:hypothetical protein
MNKPNDIVMIFCNPVKCEQPIDQARLIEKVKDMSPTIEQWLIEYLNDGARKYIALIKKTDESI